MTDRPPIPDLDREERVIGAHFAIGYDFAGKTGFAFDHYVYLLPGLLGVTSDKAPELVLYFGTTGAIRGRVIPDPLLDWSYSKYLAIGREVSGLSMQKSTQHEFSAFCSSVGDDRSLVDIWTGASAVTAAVSVVFAQYQYLSTIAPRPDVPMPAKEAAQKALFGKLRALNRLVEIWREHGKVVFDSHAQLDAIPPVAKGARTNFLEAFDFLVFHEFAHHCLGHIERNVLSNPSSEQRHRQEFEADGDAYTQLVRQRKSAEALGPFIVFVAASLLAEHDDGEATASHPPIAERFKAMVKAFIETHPDRARAEAIIYRHLLLCLQSIFSSLDDRDRFRSWLGTDKEAFMRGIQRGGAKEVVDIAFRNRTYDPGAQRFFASGSPADSPALRGRPLKISYF